MKNVQHTLNLIKSHKKPLIIFGASGCGKTTLINSTLKKYTNKFELLISHTTREMRKNESEKFYYFLKNPEFEKKIENEDFIEYVKFNNRYYGSSFSEIERIYKNNKIPILDIDYRGVKSFIKNFEKQNFLKIFINVNEKVLKQRLNKRGTDSEKDILRRLEIAKNDIKLILKEKNFDFKILNEDLYQAENELFELIGNYYKF